MIKHLQLSSVMVGITAVIIALIAVIAVFARDSHDTEALFHFAVIDEVMTSYGGDANVQFVEIQMLTTSQNLVTNSVLGAFDASGSYLGDVLVVPGDVVSGTNRPWLMATTQFTTVSGLTPDFVMPAGLPSGGGMICWGAPGSIPPAPGSWDHTNPLNYVDCLAYGSYSGPSNIHVGTPTSLDADGHSLQRGTDTNNNANDFSCADPATPTKNDFASAPLAATTACLSPTPTPTPTPCAGDLDCDGVLDGSDNCPSVANGSAEASVPGVGNQTNTDATLGGLGATVSGISIGDADGDACDSDDDDDGYTDIAEAGIGTATDDNCTNSSGPGPGPNTDAFPSDMNKDDVVAINDVTGPFAPHFGAQQGVDPTGTNAGDYNPRVDLNRDGAIAINDITGPFAPDFGKTCT